VLGLASLSQAAVADFILPSARRGSTAEALYLAMNVRPVRTDRGNDEFPEQRFFRKTLEDALVCEAERGGEDPIYNCRLTGSTAVLLEGTGQVQLLGKASVLYSLLEAQTLRRRGRDVKTLGRMTLTRQTSGFQTIHKIFYRP
jgi:hypothetical protein